MFHLSPLRLKIFTVLAAVSVIAVSGILMTASSNIVVDSSVPISLQIYWPEAGAVVTQQQTFRVAAIPGYDSSMVAVTWSVEGNKLTGAMNVEGNEYVSQVDTSAWDWKRDNSYQVTFVATTNRGLVLASTTVPIIIGTPVPEQLIVTSDVATSSVDDEFYVPEGIVAGVSQPGTLATAVAPAKPFKVTWVPGPVRNNQQFTFDTSGYAGRNLSAFWNAEGGHQNIVFKDSNTNTFATNINVFGWTWKGAGPYPITFSITDKNTSALIAQEILDLYWKGTPGTSDIEFKSRGVEIKVPASNGSTVLTSIPSLTPVAVGTPPKPKPATTAVTTPTPAPVNTPAPSPAVGTITSILGTAKVYAPAKPAVTNAITTLQNPTQKTALTYIVSQPSSIWLNGDAYETDAYIKDHITKAVAGKSVPVFVLYNIVQRDCGSYSSGGAKTVADYKKWIDRLAVVFKGTSAMIIVEPDALAMLNCVANQARTDRLDMIKYAVTTLSKTSSKVLVYIDAGHPFWVNTEEMALRLRSAGVDSARGFSINVSSYASTQDNVTYGTYLSNLLGGKKYVVDTSRNGNGHTPDRQWCNPGGRALGQSATLYPGTKGALDALLWIKYPGESDGNCNGGPGAGGWWTEYATALYTNRK